jgi:hypothetical protein
VLPSRSSWPITVLLAGHGAAAEGQRADHGHALDHGQALDHGRVPDHGAAA